MIQSSDVTEGRQCKVCRLDQASCYYKERAGDPPSITISSSNYPKEVMAGLSMGVRQITFDIKNGPSNPAKELGSCCDSGSRDFRVNNTTCVYNSL